MSSSTAVSFAPLPLRLVLGIGFTVHGYPKLLTASGYESFVGMLDGIGVPLPGLMGWLVAALELVGGLALIAGALVTIVSVLGSVNMLVALLAVHLPHGFSFMNITGQTEQGPKFGMPGYEVNLLYIAGFLALAILGGGRYSIDGAVRRLGEKKRERSG